MQETKPRFIIKKYHSILRAAFIVSALIVYLKYSKEQFPFLISKDTEQQILIYDFTIDIDTAVEMSQKTQEIMKQESFTPQTVVFAGMITEDVLLLINERNKDSKKPVNAECTLIVQPDGVRLIIRDSGVIFDITDEKAKADSYRQYVVSNLMVNHEAKLYMVTTGYNRNEFFFSRENS